ncbi:hypothetical protein Dsin_010571 [Dipteronia sinensis]|uniref:TPX2 C-terminal domain-containing protein n=1 Tax=Dipteronia sinensis TaxID=43782 RepID=A0AAE0ASS3_9ROSI|nr:hypothetical protein Dsin_010571 [Dipteronia sinensis]
MGESATLLRSFSHPSDASREAKEGDPIRALTESISFGRFMSESLAWEKWSTFSHNRYLEEVERFSKPGSVAEKKAYFEAQHKRKAALKAAKLVEEANAFANDDVPELKTTSDFHNDSPMDTKSANENSHMVIDEQKQEYMHTGDNDFPNKMESANTSSHTVIDEKNIPDTEVAHSANVTEDSGTADMEYAVDVENLNQADHSKQLQRADVHDKIAATTDEKTPNKEAVNQENSAPSSKKRQANSSSKSSTRSGPSRLPLYPAKQVPSLPPTKVNNVATNRKKCVGGSNEKRRKIPKTLHMSINFSSRASETRKASPKMLRDSSTSIQTPTKAAVKGVSKHFSKIFQSEDKRNKPLVTKSVSGGITEDGKLHSPMDSHPKSSSANGTKTQTPNKSSPFSLRSEERVAKRKEFFQKLEEKNNSTEAEKAQLKEKAEHDTKKLRQSTVLKTKQNALQEKAKHEIEKLRQSTGSKVKPNEDLHRVGSPLLSNRVKKILGTQPWSPKLGGKPTPTTVQDTSSRPPRRPSTKTESSKHVIDKNNPSTSRSITALPKLGRKPTPNMVQDTSTRPPWRSSMNAASFKRVIEKNNQSTTHSVTSLSKRNARENDSPNIQS